MCGNFAALKSKRLQKKQLEDALLVEAIVDQLSIDLENDSIYPSATSWILDREGKMRSATWGLVPTWSKDPKIARKTFNARSETLSEKPAFRDAFQEGRCIVPVQAWWEWDRHGRKTRINPAEGPSFLVAGLEANGTFTIVTQESSAELRELHHRQPVLLTPEAAKLWALTDSSPQEIREVLQARYPQPISLEIEPPKIGEQLGLLI